MTLLLRSLGLSIQGVSYLIPYTLTLARRRNKFHLLGVMAFVLGPPRNSYPPEIPEPASPRPCVNTPRYQHGPADSLAPWLEPPFLPLQSLQPWPLQAPPLAGATSLSSRPLGRLDYPSAFPSAAGTGSIALPAFGTPPRLSPPKLTLRPLSPPPRIRLDEIGGWPLGARGRTADSLRSSSHSLRGGPGVRSLADRLPDCRGADHPTPASPTWVGADATITPNQGSREKGANKVLKCTFLACVASPLPNGAQHRLPLAPEWHPQSQRPSTSPSLALHKTKGKSDQNQIEKLTNIRMTNILRKILKDQKACRGKEEVVSKKFNLGSQFKGSLLLDLLFLLLGPFIDSIT
ncbi:hypothetical protein Cgig2_012337 [Carnegiea gigantea]|uniref:Uncharacterized protein n=1 Tax=Carnegiea gigantea TaxID=171969 RepID=A0A9Q1Q551_9CARY|nr:hypothetical protein Cgig2_012337 [Carnegiea gigantea]